MNRFFYLCFIITIFSCQSRPETTIQETLNHRFEKQDTVEFNSFSYSINRDKTVIDEKGFYLLQYEYSIDILISKPQKVLMSISTPQGVIVHQNKRLVNVHENTITGYFQSYQSYPALILTLEAQKHLFTKEFSLSEIPVIPEIPVPEFITITDNNITKAFLNLFFEINGISEFIWIRLIPPDQSAYWNLVYEIENNTLKIKGVVSSEPGKPYFPNGHYLLQFNTGYLGIIEKDLIILDYLSNKEGNNYGIGPVRTLESSTEKIVFDIHNPGLVENMKLELYDSDKNLIGITSILPYSHELQKKELQKLFKAPSGKMIKPEANKLYYYRIFLYGTEMNRIRYSTVSDLLPIKFYGFRLFNF